jgi:two-component system sensor histidine kinase MprB
MPALPLDREEARFGGPQGRVQFVGPGGRPLKEGGDFTIPVDPTAASIAKGAEEEKLEDVHVDGHHLRVITAPVAGGGAIQVARPLEEVDSVLNGLVLLLAGITIGGVLLAAVLGGIVSRSSLRPVRRFTRDTESIASAPDLGRRLEVSSDDELGRLARSFNATLEALERSVSAQRHLVADASHELRTPLASLKTNLEVLLTDRRLPSAERRELLQDLVEQADELTFLVGDIVELARKGEAGATVEVRLNDGELVVRDRGPGFKDEDLPFVFDRFYRASEARKLPGSGLGLAIVRQVAESHGASVQAQNAAGGGAMLRLAFNGSKVFATS